MYQPIDTVVDGRYILPPPYRVDSGTRTVVLGVDCGQIRDYSAVCAVAYEDMCLSPGDALCNEPPVFETQYRVLGAERMPLGTSYPDVAKRVNMLAKRLYDRDSRGDYHCLIDATGVGRPVVDLIRAAMIPACHVTAVTITGTAKGDEAILWRNESSVGKAWLVSRLQAILQSGRLKAPRHAALEEMVAELKVFEIRVQANGHDTSGAFQVGTHDDLAVALSLACASDHQAVTYGPTSGQLPSPRM